MLRTTLSLLTVSLFAFSAQAQNLVTNGNFATGSLAPWVPFTTSEGTNGHAGLPNVLLVSSPRGSIHVAHFDVGQTTSSQTEQGGGISQVVLVTTAGTYDCFANIGSQNDRDGQSNTDAGTFSIVVDGTTVASTSLGAFSSPHQNIVGTVSGTVTLAAGSHTFEMLITRHYLEVNGGVTPNESVTGISMALSPLGTKP